MFPFDLRRHLKNVHQVNEVPSIRPFRRDYTISSVIGMGPALHPPGETTTAPNEPPGSSEQINNEVGQETDTQEHPEELKPVLKQRRKPGRPRRVKPQVSELQKEGLANADTEGAPEGNVAEDLLFVEEPVEGEAKAEKKRQTPRRNRTTADAPDDDSLQCHFCPALFANKTRRKRHEGLQVIF